MINLFKLFGSKLLLIVFVFFAFNTFAQTNEEENDSLSTKVLAYGLTTHNYSGLIGGAILRSSIPFSRYKNHTVNQYLAVELVGIKNPRESNYLSVLGTKYIFGKTNYFFSIRPQYGREFFLFGSANENSLALSAVFAVGPSIGVTKPYLIKYQFPNSSQAEVIQYDPDITSSPGNILGSSSFLQNFTKGLKVIPGAHFKAALNLDKQVFNNNITGFELGTVLEVFSKKPEIIASKFSKNQQFFSTVYLTLYLGNKKLVKKPKK